MACRAHAERMVKMCAMKELSRRVNEMGYRTKMARGATQAAAEPETISEAVHLLANTYA